MMNFLYHSKFSFIEFLTIRGQMNIIMNKIHLSSIYMLLDNLDSRTRAMALLDECYAIKLFCHILLNLLYFLL